MNEIAQRIEADLVVSVSDLKRNPSAVLKQAESAAVAILNHNKVVGYLISPEAYEEILERLDDLDLIGIINEREGEAAISVDINDL
jgi:antitoxin StbD